MVKGIFITATGTDVGKTYISALLVKALKGKNIDCGYYKPVLSGAEIKNGEVVAGDVEHVLKTAQIAGKSTDFVSYLFTDAVSPHLAANLKGVNISIRKIVNDFNAISAGCDFTVVEGAGGIICPLNIESGFFMYNLVEALELDVVVVADAGLGTINNTYLTLDFLRRIGVKVKGVILNNFDNKNYVHIDNKSVIEKMCNVRILGTVAYNATDIDFEQNALGVIYG